MLPYLFKDSEKTIRITDPRLPSPWINYLSNGTLHAFVSQAAGGFAWYKTPLKNRMTRYRGYNQPIDSPGFCVYIKEKGKPAWSPSWRPCETTLDSYSAEHRPGATTFYAEKDSLSCELELFIPPSLDVLIWDVRLKNNSTETKDIDLFGYVEFSLLDWKQDTDWACYVKHNLEAFFDKELNGVVYLYRHFHFNPRLADCPLTWFSSSEPVTGWDCDRDLFTGNYRSERNPEAIEEGRCRNSNLLCGDPCGALHNRMVIGAGDSRRLHYFLGAVPQAIVKWPSALERSKEMKKDLGAPGRVDELKKELAAWWKNHLDVLTVNLPDPDLQRQVAIWTPVQTVHTGRYSRSISQHASGVRTLGYRDTCQDMLSLVPRQTDWAKQIFRYLISQQYPDGHTPHQCNPVEQLPAEPRVHIDNPLWLPILAAALIAETGDISLLNESVDWLSPKDNYSSIGNASVWDHLFQVSEFIEANLGAHKLPLIHHGDWNDSIGKFGKKGRGESVFAAQQYIYDLTLLLKMAILLKDEKRQSVLMVRLSAMKLAVENCCWDGEWWIRAYDDEGSAVGSSTNAYGKIWLNSQTWSVIAGSGSKEKNSLAMDSVARYLDTKKYGIQKLHPSYPSFPEAADPYSGYSKGCGENGAVFCHANTWAVIAESLLGRADRAWGYYRQLVPHIALQTVGLSRYQAEPYAWVSNIIGPDNPKWGWANVTQVTGTATWMEVAASQYLIGIRPEIGEIVFDPQLPSDWDGFSATRLFRGAEIIMTVKRGLNSGITVDGKKIEGCRMDSTGIQKGKKYTVEVIVK